MEATGNLEESGEEEANSESAAELGQMNVTFASPEAGPSWVPDESVGSDSAMVSVDEQNRELEALCGVSVYNQMDLEEEVMKQVDQKEKERQEAVAKIELEKVNADIRSVKQRLSHIQKAMAMPPGDQSTWSKEIKRRIEAIKREKENKEKQMKKLMAKQKALLARIDGQRLMDEFLENDVDDDEEEMDPESLYELENIFGLRKKETDREKMIRTGQMTPFGTVIEAKKAPKIVQSTGLTDFEKYLLSQAELKEQKLAKKKTVEVSEKQDVHKKHKVEKTKPKHSSPSTSVPPLKPIRTKKKMLTEKLGTLTPGIDKMPERRRRYPWRDPENVIDLDEFDHRRLSDSDYIPSSEGEEETVKPPRKFKSKALKRKHSSSDDEEDEKEPSRSKSKRYLDDGNQDDYLKRIKKWKHERLKVKHSKMLAGEEESIDPMEDYQNLDDGFKVPLKIWNSLYKYQQTCVQWLWELHCQQCGGIIGDEMGLGKTIQVIAFLAGLWFSKMITRGDKFRGLGPVLIVTPTTVMQQWVKEFHTWWPPFRVGVLHESGSHTGTKESLIRNINNNNGILITSYNGVNLHQQLLVRYEWHYVILDEGHKIRNPDAQITLACKQFPTPHRIILSGSPLQNNLKELWSLFDFIFPGKLGTLPVFMEQFSVPITLGGYANASQVQIRVAYKCATVLRDTINPYLLRRMKSDVKMNLSLPNKNEQVLFCQLTEEQRNTYKEYLDSDQLKSIMDNRLQVFVGLIALRKICNHPDLYTGGPKHFGVTDMTALSEEQRFGHWRRSGKMIVVEAILKIWHEQEHRVLLFTQSRQMLQILEYFVKTRNYSYLKMDGTTSIGSRQPLITKFNTDKSIFVFILTTRVGGLGVNLTGANRVIIFDPDWNPSTDLQAKERVWRIGQEKNVTIYRLLTTGTIEEKIYHRQIFKQFLTNRVLKDPRQRRFFKNNELYELFTLQDQGTQGAETLAVFAGTGSEIKPSAFKSSSAKHKKKREEAKKPRMEDRSSKIKQENGGESTNHNVTLEQSTSVYKQANDCVIKDESKPDVPVGEALLDGCKNEEINISNNTESEKAASEEQCNDEMEKKRLQMREMARRLSQQLANTFKNKQATQCNNGNRSSKERGGSLSKKQTKRKKKKVLFEGKEVNGLVRLEAYSKDEEEAAQERDKKHDDYVLKKLFAKTGLQSALQHDKVMDAPEADYAIVEREAEQVAKESVKKLKQSRRFCFQATEGIPNWTGSKETLPPRPKPRFGQKKNSQLVCNATASTSTASQDASKKSESQSSSSSSSTYNSKTNMFMSGNFATPIVSTQELISKIKERDKLDDESESSDEEFTTQLPALTSEHDELLVDIRNFIAFQSKVNGQAKTAELLEHFQPRLPCDKSALFKALLNQICNFTKETRTWYLKPEFR